MTEAPRLSFRSRSPGSRSPGPAGFVLLALLAGLVALPAAGGGGAPVLHLAALADGGLAVAGGGGLYRVDPATGKARPLAALDGEVRGLAVAGESLVVAFGGGEPHLAFFDRAGRSQGAWERLPVTRVGGLAAHGERLFVTGVTGFQIHRLEKRSEAASTVARIYGARSVGALARSPRGTFYVADPSQGVVLAVTGGSRTSSPLAEDAGTPVALAVDAQGDRLLILDALNGLIWSAPLEVPRVSSGGATISKRIKVQGISYRTAETSRQLARLRAWRSPAALAVTADGSIWWADAGTGELVKLDGEGEEVARYPLPWATKRSSR